MKISKRLNRNREWAADVTGSVLPIMAISFPILLMLAGAGIDFSRVYIAKSRLQAACDAGALAGRKAVSSSGFDGTAAAVAQKYFNANFDIQSAQAKNGSAVFVSPDLGTTINGTATANVTTLILRFVSINDVSITVNCAATMAVGNSDITMVLDTTGSMAGTRIAGLNTAMKNFYTTMAAATQGTTARIRYAFVPYSSAVNVGHLLYDKNPDYLANTNVIQSREPIYTGGTNPVFKGFTYKQVAWNVAGYKAGGVLTYTGDDGSPKTTTWDGCIEERKTVNASSFSFAAGDGIQPDGALDLDIDAGAEDDPGGQWLPMVSSVAYIRGNYRKAGSSLSPLDVTTNPTGGQPGALFYACPKKAQLLEEMTRP